MQSSRHGEADATAGGAGGIFEADELIEDGLEPVEHRFVHEELDRRDVPALGPAADAIVRVDEDVGSVTAPTMTTGIVTRGDVVELVLNGVPANREELSGYGLSEEIIHYKRRWFVLTDDVDGVLPGLLARRKPVRDTTAHDANP